MSLNRHFGAALKKYLELNGMNKSWLAREMNITPQAVTSLFNSESPRNHTKDSVMAVLKITEKQLFENEKMDGPDLEKIIKELEEKLNTANERLIKYQREEIKGLQEVRS